MSSHCSISHVSNTSNDSCGAQYFVALAHLSIRAQGPSRGGLWPKIGKYKYKIILGHNRGRFSPRHVRSLTGRKDKNGIYLH